MATSGLWNITALIPRASPSGSGRLYSITPRWPWHNYYLTSSLLQTLLSYSRIVACFYTNELQLILRYILSDLGLVE